MYKQGDILLIPIPFSNLSITKQRPVLVLSNDNYNQFTKDLLVAAITSQLKDIDYSILITQDDLAEGNLKVTSAIRADKIYTLRAVLKEKKRLDCFGGGLAFSVRPCASPGRCLLHMLAGDLR